MSSLAQYPMAINQLQFFYACKNLLKFKHTVIKVNLLEIHFYNMFNTQERHALNSLLQSNLLLYFSKNFDKR